MMRHAAPAALAEALRASREDTLRTFADYRRALPDLRVPQDAALNPPLWELGHIGWFQEYWIARNPQRALGPRADPDAARAAPLRKDADALYNSSRVAHGRRWSLPLPDAEATLADLERQFAGTIALLAATPGEDEALYFFRLALAHEDMHHEAAIYMAQTLAIDVEQPAAPQPLPVPGGELELPAGFFHLGSGSQGFAFDNELGTHEVEVGAFRIDRCARRWRDVLPFVESGGYAQPQWWSDAGRAWLQASGLRHPRHLRRAGSGWQRRVGSGWQPLDADAPACHLSAHEAAAWCAWAGRRLPSEAQWERAAIEAPEAFAWGEVWEWTSSPFRPYPGFSAHPYRDYSAPWFDGRPVLRGASFATSARLRHPRYRNYFTAERNDIFAGLRSCAVDPP
ncbi:selenoneine synthase SenA [uncultured Piscinibacter sp.]|uniref:selenoneine synthase SenA n=1 Tax=uncultured Piscinibacter sp. TaxID=1131835 RepID=UPI0026206DC5|nr:selenoneine synthase SenA [uncultured Piscinibacter sp.]